MKTEIKLNRSDDRPIAFMGEEVFSESTKNRDTTRWHVIRGFKTDNGYMLGIALITCWENERDKYWAIKAKNKKAILEIVRRYVPELEAVIAARLGLNEPVGNRMES